jgi:hypothetical protein
MECSVVKIEKMTGPLAIVGVPMAVSPVTKMQSMTYTIKILPLRTYTVIVEIGIPVVVNPVILDVVVSHMTKIPGKT